MLKNCLICNAEYKTSGKQSQSRKTCSKACSSEYRRAEAETECTYCKKRFHMKEFQKQRYSRTHGYFCSKVCCNENKKTAYLGAGNPNNRWRETYYHGYTLSHSKYGKMQTHKLLTLEYLEIASIPKGYVIHHRDCDKLNNDLDNLVLLSNADHLWLHKNFGNATLRAYCQGLVSLETLCVWCRDFDRARKLLPLNLKTQKQLEVFKLGEFLGSHEDGNQKPSYT